MLHAIDRWLNAMDYVEARRQLDRNYDKACRHMAQTAAQYRRNNYRGPWY